MTCHNCRCQCKKFGRYGVERIQRFRCKQCGKTFAEIPDRPLDRLRVEFDKAVQVISLLTEGCGIRATSRLTQLHQGTILNLLETVGQKSANFLDARVRNLTVEQVQTDEIWSYVFCKEVRKKQNNLEHGDQFTYLSFDRASKLIINHYVGKRMAENCHILMKDLQTRISGRFQLSTDNFGPYRGKTGAVGTAFGKAIDFGIITKVYANRVYGKRNSMKPACIMVKKTVQIGEPDFDMICTSHVERQNLNVRLFNRRFTRLTMGFSKKLANLKFSVALFVAYWNFCWIHGTTKQTPAMASGLADHPWTVAKLMLNLTPF